MLDFFFGNIELWQGILLACSAVLIGINKTGLPGLGLIPVIILVFTFDPKISTGVQLAMLCTADLFAVLWYHRTANWRIIAKIMPAALIGILLGILLIRRLDARTMMLTIGLVILALSAVSILREIFWNSAEKVPSHWAFSILAGVLAGFSTHIANAAGPVMALYLLAMRLPKDEYMGTSAWFFMLINWTKLPILFMEGRLTFQALRMDLGMLPFLIAGAALGILMLNKMPVKFFNRLVLLLSVTASIYMVIRSL